MPTATEYLTNLITTQIHDRHLIVWFDPEKHYAHILQNLDLAGVSIHSYSGSFIELRNEVAGLMTAERPPDLLLYIPMEERKTSNALVAFTKSGVTLQPGQHPWQRNTRLSVIARQVLKDHLSDEELSAIEGKIEAGHLTLADIDHMTEMVLPSIPEALTLVYRTHSSSEILLAFMTNDERDGDLKTKGLIPDISSLITTTVGFVPNDDSLERTRADLIKYLLLSAFIHEIGEIPPELVKVAHAEDIQSLEICNNLAYNWQNQRESADQYEQYSRNIEDILHLSNLNIPHDKLMNSRIFPGTERLLISAAEDACINGAESALDIGELAKHRFTMYWSQQDPAISFRWKILEEISEFFSRCADIEENLQKKVWSAQELISAYSDQKTGWYLMDTLHRTILKHQYDDNLDTGKQDDILDHIINKVQNQYSATADLMTNALTQAMVHEGMSQVTFPLQTCIFSNFIHPDAESGKTAYILVDAFRYEMGVSLQTALNSKGELFTALAMLPSYTPVGMAALLPGAENGFEIIFAPNGKLKPVVDGTPLLTRDERIAYLEQKISGDLAVLKLSDLIPRPKNKIEERIKESSFILITSQEIDTAGEQIEPHLARQYMDKVISDLQRAITHLTRIGVTKIIVTADHGYLFGEELFEARKIDPPGGQTVALHRRFWVGTGGEARDSYVRIRPEAIGVKSELEFAYPSGIGAFKAKGGGTAYYHGGISLQELIIPVLVIENVADQPSLDSRIAWSLSISGSKISSRMVSVKINGTVTSITCDQIPKVRVEIRAENQSISTTLAAHYDYLEATGEIRMKTSQEPGKTRNLEENTAVMQITSIPASMQATIHLLDSETDVELARIGPFQIDISFG
jgi:hypothetical protein